MISFIRPLTAGNAVQVLLAPPAWAVGWRVLRKVSDTFTGETDPAAGVVHDGRDDALVDIAGLTNGQPYYYKPYYLDAGGAWTPGPTAQATPSATAELAGVDPLNLVRERLELGLKAAVAAGELAHDQGYIPCLTQPPTFESTRFPIVTVHLQNSSRVVGGVGETVAAPEFDAIADEWDEFEGWINSVQLQIISWVVANADERAALRQAIAKVLLANLPIFNAQGLSHIEFSQSDLEDMETYSAPMFQTLTPFSCFAPMAVSAKSAAIASVGLEADFA